MYMQSYFPSRMDWSVIADRQAVNAKGPGHISDLSGSYTLSDILFGNASCIHPLLKLIFPF
jgi:hypothetical protein